jgi:hypothetical protein
MTEQPPKNDEERPETPPSANASDSSTGLVDIHQLPHPKPENGEAPPAMPAHQPLAASEEPSANEVEPPSVDVQPEVPLAADTVANPFETINDHHHGDSPATDATAPTSAIGMGSGLGSFAIPASTPPTTTDAAPIASQASPSVQPQSGSSLNMLLLTWASLATLTAIYLWWTRPEHPSTLETIPDDGVLTSMLSNKSKVSPLSSLDESLVVRFNETRRLGNLEVTPLAVEHRRVKVMTSDEQVAYEPTVLALRLQVKNVGAVPFAPSDPVFTSLIDKSTQARGKREVRVKGKVVFADGYTYTFAHPVADVENMDKRILPLSVEYSRKERVAEQTFPVLQAGESAEVVILSQEDALPKVNGPMLWRVKLRKGRTAKGTGAAVVIGVPFTKENVAMIAPEPTNSLDG